MILSKTSLLLHTLRVTSASDNLALPRYFEEFHPKFDQKRDTSDETNLLNYSPGIASDEIEGSRGVFLNPC